MIFVFIALIVIFIFVYNNWIDQKEISNQAKKYYGIIMESDYKFLVALKYGDSDIDVDELFGLRVRNAILVLFFVVFIFLLTNFTLINLIIAVAVGFAVFKMPYYNLKSYRKANINRINLMLPYYLKSLEILVQHYTVPVALIKSIDSAPDIFKKGLRELIEKIEAGDSSIQPYMDFAIEYPVRDSMRMMRLLYRLSLGSQENKQQQLELFSKNVSSLQNKTRELKYQNRLETMEKKTMIMLFGTGGGIIVLLLLSMMLMMGI